MNKYFCTFGQNQTLKNNYVVIDADTFDEARRAMHKHYGAMWAFMHNEEEFGDQPAKYGLMEVPFGTPNKRICEVMGEHSCTDRSQCFEPCGDLGHDAEHAKPVDDNTMHMLDALLAPLTEMDFRKAATQYLLELGAVKRKLLESDRKYIERGLQIERLEIAVKRGPLSYDLEDLAGSFVDKDGKTHTWFDENMALGLLLLDEVLFCNQRKYVEVDGTITQSITVLFVLCNDVFLWGSADGEPLLNSDIEPLFSLCKKCHGKRLQADMARIIEFNRRLKIEIVERKRQEASE